MARIDTTVAIGDSVVWGQGLPHERKFVSQVHSSLSGGRRLPEVNIKAHSGAVIGLERNGDRLVEADHSGIEEEIGFVGTRTGRHDVPHGGLSILQQLDRLPYDYASSDGPPGENLKREANRAYESVDDVELLILDGGINDVDKLSLALPWTEHDNLEAQIRRHCYEDLKYLIRKARRKFPSAVLIVTAYFPIASFESDLPIEELALGMAILFGAGAGVATEIAGLITKPHLIRNALFFHRRQLHYVRRAVAEQDRDLEGPGILFASPGFEFANSAHASDPWLWDLSSEGESGVALERQAVCTAHEERAEHDTSRQYSRV